MWTGVSGRGWQAARGIPGRPAAGWGALTKIYSLDHIVEEVGARTSVYFINF